MTRASDLARLIGAGATINDGTTITTADNTSQLILTSTDADSSIGPVLELARDSSSPADGDAIGQVKFTADNDAGEATGYATITGTLRDASDGTEDAQVQYNAMVGGSSVDFMRYGVGGDAEIGVIFNEGSIDADFRVESDGNANAFFLEGSTGRIGMGTSSMGDYHANRDDLVIATSGSTGITLVAGGSGHQSAIAFADGTGDSEEDAGLLMYNHNGNVMSFHVSDSERFRATSNGLHVNSTRDVARICVDSNIASFAILSLKNDTNNTGSFFVSLLNHSGSGIGGISQASETTLAFNTSSDYRLKENVEYDWDATTRLKQLKPCRFNWISDDTNTAQDGFLAHEVSDVVPLAINGVKDGIRDIGTIKDADGNVLQEDAPEIRKEDGQTWTKTGTEVVYQSIDHSKLVPLLTKALQEQQAIIESLTARITALESK